MQTVRGQSKAAKEAWARLGRGKKPSVFEFGRYPGLIEFANKSIPPNSHVVLLGGGRGYAGELLKGRNGHRTFLNVELGDVPEPFLPTIQGDMEEPMQRERLGANGKPLTLWTPFSVEYTNIGLSTENMAGVLAVGELWLTFCHHAQSGVIEQFRRVKRILDLIDSVLPRIKAMNEWRWKEVAIEAEEAVHRIYEGVIKKQPIISSDTERFRRMMNRAWEMQSSGIGRAYLFLGYLRQGTELEITRENAIDGIEWIRERTLASVKRAEPLMDRAFRHSRELAEAVDPRFRLLDGDAHLNYYDKIATSIIAAVFVRT